MVNVLGVFKGLIKKKKNIQWEEISRETSLNSAKAVQVYFKTLGVETQIVRRKDGRFAVFMEQRADVSKEYGSKFEKGARPFFGWR